MCVTTGVITTTLPSWRHCGTGAGPADPVGCRGIRTGSRTACLAHLSAADRAACLAALGPGADVDLRGTAFSEDLLRALFDAVRDPVSGDPAFGEAQFVGASFSGTARFGGAVFTEPVTIEAAAAEIACRRTRWESTAILRPRHARVDLTDGRPTQPIAVVGQFIPFASAPARAEEALGSDPVVRVASIRGVDASMLTLADLNLAECVFTGALHLDQLRLEGLSVFGTTPGGRRTRARSPSAGPGGRSSRRSGSGGPCPGSVQVVLNSVIFRAGGQSLTTAGTYIEMTSRLIEPGFLALALLAVRGRLKR